MEYDEWIDNIFNRKLLNQFELDWDEYWIGEVDRQPSRVILDLIIETFTKAGEDLRPFSDEQVAVGLKFITNEAAEPLHKIYDVDVATSQRLAVINAIYVLFRDCLALRCGNDPETESTNCLDGYAYMFWDAGALCIYGVIHTEVEAKDELIDAILDVLEGTLKISNATCQRAAIHGLGHEKRSIDRYYPKGKRYTNWLRRIDEMIDRYCGLSTTHEALREYARQAKTGMIN